MKAKRKILLFIIFLTSIALIITLFAFIKDYQSESLVEKQEEDNSQKVEEIEQINITPQNNLVETQPLRKEEFSFDIEKLNTAQASRPTLLYGKIRLVHEFINPSPNTQLNYTVLKEGQTVKIYAISPDLKDLHELLQIRSPEYVKISFSLDSGNYTLETYEAYSDKEPDQTWEIEVNNGGSNPSVGILNSTSEKWNKMYMGPTIVEKQCVGSSDCANSMCCRVGSSVNKKYAEDCGNVGCLHVYTPPKHTFQCILNQCTTIYEETTNTSLFNLTIFDCEVDSDCTVVDSGCCGCTGGGGQISINKEYEETYYSTLKEERCLEFSLCPAVMSQHISCFSKPPKCNEGICELVPDEEAICGFCKDFNNPINQDMCNPYKEICS